MSSKSMITMLSYTVSNFARFFWDTVYIDDIAALRTNYAT